MLLEFPSVVDAVRCSVAIQEGVRERNRGIGDDKGLRFPIGIHLGDVIAEGSDLLGDGVNVAARLEGLSVPGGVVLSDDAYRQVRDRLDYTWVDDGEHEVKNIARPVQVWRWAPTDGPFKGVAPLSAGTSLPLPSKPSIAVLPFDNMSGDTDQEYFADGLAEDLITALSMLRNLGVAARNTSFAYKGRSVDIRKIREELGIGYVLEGSVRKSGDRARVTAQLIDANSGKHVWAEKYDRKITDIFDLQDELTEKIATAIEPEITRARTRRPAYPRHLSDGPQRLSSAAK